MSMCSTISYLYFGGIRKLVVQIPSMDMILTGYWTAGQVRNMISSIMYKSKVSIGGGNNLEVTHDAMCNVIEVPLEEYHDHCSTWNW